MHYNRPEYRFYVVNASAGTIDSGWEQRLDAMERAVALKEEGVANAKVMTRPRVWDKPLDPNYDANWTSTRTNPGKKYSGSTMPRRGSGYTAHSYLTTFCNKAHRLADGKPIGHNCYVLDPVKLRLEAEGRIDEIEGSIVKEPRRDEMRCGTRENPDSRAKIYFYVDGAGPWTLEQMLEANRDYPGDIEDVLTSMHPGEVRVVGGGAHAEFEIRAASTRRNPGELLVVNPATSPRAERVYKMWHQKDPHNAFTLKTGCRDDDAMVCVGRAHNIVYRSGKWEKGRKTNDYIHHFDSKPKVWMVARIVEAGSTPGDQIGGAEKAVGDLMRALQNGDGRYEVAELAAPISLGLDDGTTEGNDIKIHAGSKVYGGVDRKTVIIFDPHWKLIVIKGGKMHFDERGIVK